MSLAQQAVEAWNAFKDLPAGTPEKAAALDRLNAANAARDAGGMGVTSAGGGGGADGMSAYTAYLRERDAEIARQQREAAISFLRGILETYNMGSLADRVDTLVRQWGSNTEVIAEKLRQTDEYKTRFKGLVELQKRGITDVRNEADYLELETGYRGVFREAGLRDFLGQSGTQAEYDAIAKLVGDYSLSVNEVRSRVMDAQRVAVETPQEVRDALQRYYNVGAQDLVAYSLDPQRTMNRINEKANAAILGGYAARAGLDIGVGAAESIAGLAGGEDLSLEAVQRNVSQAREVRDATRRLAEIESSVLTDEDVLTAQAGVAPEAGERIRTLQSRERARFGGTAAFASRSLAQPRSV